MTTRNAPHGGQQNSSGAGLLVVIVLIVAVGGLCAVAGALSGLLAGNGWAWPAGDGPALFTG
ncbi:hypothetical protein M1C59_25545 (plasmid) [Gordonia terrae]|nr:hypothetical protein [Gordonia terrae]UPW12018.1 hypothetical protein M1C59_25545 [Gordonia terrae]